VTELQTLTGSFINQIYQRAPDELFIRLNIKKHKDKPLLYIKNEELCTITTQKYIMPTKPSTFAMTLRKHLENGIITSITQHEFDRIINITISKYDITYILAIELFSNGNILLIDNTNTIVIPLKTQQWAHRTIRPRKTYQPPPCQTNPFTQTQNKFQHILRESNKDIVRTLALNLNMGGLYAEELCMRANIDKNISTKQLSDETINHLFFKLTELLDIFKNHQFTPQLITDNEDIIDILPISFEIYTKTKNIISLDTFTDGLAKLIPETSQNINQKPTDAISPKQQRLQRQLTQQQETIKEFKKTIELKKRHGDLLYFHFQPITELLDHITKTLPKKDKETDLHYIRQNPLVKYFEPTAKELILILTDNENNSYDVPINFRKTVAENANIAYTTSKKNQKKLQRAKEEIEKTKYKLITLETQQKELTPKEQEKIIKKFWFEKYHWCQSRQGNLIIAGKDAKTNEYLVKKHLKEGDRYVHADIHGAPSCIVKKHTPTNQPTTINQDTLTEASIFAASYSKAWNQFVEEQVYWVLPEQVSKTSQTGEFVPKGAFVIRGKRNYIRSPLELALGRIEIENVPKTMCAPTITISHYTKKYIVIKPGSNTKNDLAKKISTIMNLSIAEVHQLLPSGQSDIVEIHGYVNHGTESS
jgi:predicted ribosome quality control (RQC) complex YloA/Tae2 family protein